LLFVNSVLLNLQTVTQGKSSLCPAVMPMSMTVTAVPAARRLRTGGRRAALFLGIGTDPLVDLPHGHALNLLYGDVRVQFPQKQIRLVFAYRHSVAVGLLQRLRAAGVTANVPPAGGALLHNLVDLPALFLALAGHGQREDAVLEIDLHLRI